MKYTLDDLLKDMKEHKKQDFGIADKTILRARMKAKKEELKSEKNYILRTTYPILSLGLRWTYPRETIDEDSDVLMATIDPVYLPWKRENAVCLKIGTSILEHQGLFIIDVTFGSLNRLITTMKKPNTTP